MISISEKDAVVVSIPTVDTVDVAARQLVVIDQPSRFQVSVEDADVVSVCQPEIQVITIGGQGPAGPAGSGGGMYEPMVIVVGGMPELVFSIEGDVVMGHVS